MNISSIIRELLLYHAKAVIPEFGAFTIGHKPAELDKTTGILSPPSREVQFNDMIKTDDGQLSNYLLRKHQLNKEEAVKAISGFVRSINNQLSAEGTAFIEGIGSLSSGKPGKLIFYPLEELLSKINIVELPKLDILAAPSVTQLVTRQEPMASGIKARAVRKRKWWIPAAIVFLLVGLSALIYLTGLYKTLLPGIKTTLTASADSGQTDRLVFGNRTDAETDTLQDRISRELDNRTARQEALQYKESEGKPVETVESKPNETNKTILISPEKPYHIIAGAFLVPNNAERHIKRLEQKGFSPGMLPKQGDYYMVCLGSFDSRRQAETAMRQMHERAGLELWILVKK